MEEIAARLELDPVELRRRNLLRAGDRGPTGELMRDPGLDDCVEAVSERLESWRREAPEPQAARRRGIGLACAGWLTTGAPSGATVTMNEDGTASLATGGTAAAAGELVYRQGAHVVAYAFVIELASLSGRERLTPTPVISIVRYD